MNIFKRIILRTFFPCMSATIQLAKSQARWAEKETRDALVANAHRAEVQQRVIGRVCDERDLCLDNLMTLVAKDDAGDWTTVFDADTRLPREISNYLDGLVQRA